MTFHFARARDPNFNLKVKAWGILISGMGGPIDMVRRDVSYPSTTMPFTFAYSWRGG